MVGGDSPVARPRGCRPRGGYVAGYRAGVHLTHRVTASAAPRPMLCGERVRPRCRPPLLRHSGRVLAATARRDASPTLPGSYQFRDRDGRVIYVGKAKSLRSRLSNYFQNPANLPPRTAQMVAQAETVEWIQVRNDVEAIMLEYSLIKQHKPRFNVRLRDDKSYPFLAVTVSDEWPRAMVRRGTKDKGSLYFGPYAHAYAIRETLDSLLRTFPIRTCSDNKFRTHQRLGQALPAVPHREVLRARASAIDHDDLRRPGRRAGGLPRRRHPAGRQAARGGDARGLRHPRVRAGRPAARPADRGAQGHREAADGDRAGRGPRLLRPGRGRAGGGHPGLLRAAGPGGRPQGLHRRQGRGPHPGPAGGPGAGAALRRRPAGVPPAGAGPGRRPTTPTPMEDAGWRSCGAGAGRRRRRGSRRRRRSADVEWWAATGPLPGRAQRQPRGPGRAPASRSGSRSGATRRPCWRWSPATPARSSPGTG